MTCYFYINVAGCGVNESSVLDVEILVRVPVPFPANRRPAPTSAVIDRGMIRIKGFPPYNKHTSRLQASSLCGRKSPWSCLYISGRCPSVNPHLFARVDFSANLQLSPRGIGRKDEKIRRVRYTLRVRKSSRVIDSSISRRETSSGAVDVRMTYLRT